MLLVTLATPTAAQADFIQSRPNDALQLMHKIRDYRLSHFGNYLKRSVRGDAAALALSKANYHEGRWTSRIEGVPFAIWSYGFFGNRARSEIAAKSCHSKYLSPKNAFLHFVSNDLESYLMGKDPTWRKIAVRAVEFRRNKRDFRHKGVCTAYYVFFQGRMF